MIAVYYIQPALRNNSEEKAERKDMENVRLVRIWGWMFEVSGKAMWIRHFKYRYSLTWDRWFPSPKVKNSMCACVCFLICVCVCVLKTDCISNLTHCLQNTWQKRFKKGSAWLLQFGWRLMSEYVASVSRKQRQTVAQFTVSFPSAHSSGTWDGFVYSPGGASCFS